MDRTSDWIESIESVCRLQQLAQEEVAQIKQTLLLKPVRQQSQFAAATQQVRDSIVQLAAFIQERKRDYVSAGRYSQSDKDAMEEEVGSTVRAATARIEQLKESVVVASQAHAGRPPDINQQTAAHLHGVVLALVEQLHAVSAGFDRCRAVRYQQTLEQEMRSRPVRRPVVAAANGDGSAGSSNGGQHSSEAAAGQQLQQQAFQDLEAKQLMEDLVRSSQQAFNVEKTMREITTLNQMISTAVMHQAEVIEQLYNTAVDATLNLQRGNESLRKTISVNRSSRWYVFVMMMTASALLLFFDWFYS